MLFIWQHQSLLIQLLQIQHTYYINKCIHKKGDVLQSSSFCYCIHRHLWFKPMYIHQTMQNKYLHTKQNIYMILYILNFNNTFFLPDNTWQMLKIIEIHLNTIIIPSFPVRHLRTELKFWHSQREVQFSVVTVSKAQVLRNNLTLV